MSEKIKFTEEELSEVRKIQEELTIKIVEFGQLRISIMDLEDELQEMKKAETDKKSELNQIRNRENQLGKALSDKYGDGKLDVLTGFFEKSQ